MALNTFGWTPAEVTTDSAGNAIAGAELTVWEDLERTTPIQFAYDRDGTTLLPTKTVYAKGDTTTALTSAVVTSGAKGRFGFIAQDTYSLVYVWDGSSDDPWPVAAHEALDSGSATHAQAVADAQAAADSAAASAALVGAPAGSAIDARLGGDSTNLIATVGKKITKGDLRINVLDWGVIGNNVANDTAALTSAAAEALSKKRVLWIPPGLTGVRILSQVDLRNIDIDFESAVIVAHTNDIGLRVGGASTNTSRRVIKLADVHNAAANPTYPSIRVTGLKNGETTVGNCDYLQLFADANVADSSSIAYSKFWLGRKINKLELFGQNGVAWINENTFYGGAIDTLIVGGSYHHNSNLWLKPAIENPSSSITFNMGVSNRIEDARGEGGPTLTFAAGTHSNVVSVGYNSLRVSFAAPFAVTDNGDNNIVVGPLGRTQRPVELARIDSTSRIFNGCAEFPTASPPIPGLRSLQARASNADIIDTGLIPLERLGIGSLANEGVSRMRRFSVVSSHQLWRPAVEVYDVNRVKLDTTPGTHIDLNGGWVSQGSGAIYGLGTTTSQVRLLVIDPAVKYVRIRLQTSMAAGTAFDWVTIVGYIQGDSLPNVAEAVKSGMRRPLYQAAAPTQGAAYLGESIGNATGRFTCVARVDTTLTAAAAAAATTLTVATITGINSGDVIGVLTDDGKTHWTTVSGAPSAGTVTLAAALPSGAAIGNAIVTNRWV